MQEEGKRQDLTFKLFKLPFWSAASQTAERGPLCLFCQSRPLPCFSWHPFGHAGEQRTLWLGMKRPEIQRDGSGKRQQASPGPETRAPVFGRNSRRLFDSRPIKLPPHQRTRAQVGVLQSIRKAVQIHFAMAVARYEYACPLMKQ